VHGFSLFPTRRFLIMDFRVRYSPIGDTQKITMYSQGQRRQFYNFIVSKETFLIIVKLSRTYYEPWYLFRSYEKTYSKCSSLLLSSEPTWVTDMWAIKPATWTHGPPEETNLKLGTQRLGTGTSTGTKFSTPYRYYSCICVTSTTLSLKIAARRARGAALVRPGY
jgi:hypothetical protein